MLPLKNVQAQPGLSMPAAEQVPEQAPAPTLKQTSVHLPAPAANHHQKVGRL
jgi:hypothetical protein